MIRKIADKPTHYLGYSVEAGPAPSAPYVGTDDHAAPILASQPNLAELQEDDDGALEYTYSTEWGTPTKPANLRLVNGAVSGFRALRVVPYFGPLKGDPLYAPFLPYSAPGPIH